MSERDFLCMIGELCDEAMSKRKNEDYVINRPQYEKFNALMRFFLEKANELGGTIVPKEIVPKEVHGDITVCFTVFDLVGADILRFCELMKACSAVSIDVTNEDQVCISCVVPDIFVKKEAD